MARSPKTPGSRASLPEVARHVIEPAGMVTTGWPAAEKKLRDLGIEFDPWQVDLSQLILAKNVRGKYVHTVGGIVLSIPRQVGKTFTIGSLMFAICLLFPGTKVLWTAHRMRTASESFTSMQTLSKRKRVAPYMLRPVLGSGEEEIRFRNGSRILFGAREKGFGLGMTNVDVLMFDEAQRLTESAIDDMVPSTNQTQHPAGALLFYAGTPPRPKDPGEVFRRKRREALAGLVDDTLYVEFSADKGALPMDRKQWAIANPSYPKRTPEESMLRMIRQLGPESVPREMYGIWDEDSTNDLVISMDEWGLCRNRDAPAPARAAVVVDVDPDRKRSSIGVAGGGPGGGTLVMVQTKPGVAWLVPALTELTGSQDIAEVSVTPGGQAAGLVPDLREAGVKFESLVNKDIAQGCAAFQESVRERRVVHVGQPDLDAAIRGARTRFVGESEVWDRRDHSIDISPLVACATAAHRWRLAAASTSVYESRGLVTL
jgi:hypothetical protein